MIHRQIHKNLGKDQQIDSWHLTESRGDLSTIELTKLLAALTHPGVVQILGLFVGVVVRMEVVVEGVLTNGGRNGPGRTFSISEDRVCLERKRNLPLLLSKVRITSNKMKQRRARRKRIGMRTLSSPVRPRHHRAVP